MSRILYPILLGFVLCCGVHAQSDEIPLDTEIKTTASGLKYSVLTAGPADGKRPKMGDTVEVHYQGWLADGTVFDSSYKRNRPAKFKIGQVIEGWNEGLGLMTVGAKHKLTIPFALAYGEQGRGTIPPKADLIFVVELLGLTEGPKLPEFTKPSAENLKTTKSGLRYEMVKAGEGDVAGPNDLVRFRYAFWTEEGTLVGCTELDGGRSLCNTKDDWASRNEFLSEALDFAKPGAVYRFVVPPELCFKDRAQGKLGANSVSVWEIRYDLTIPFDTVEGDDVKTTESGLKYKVIREGTGAKPASDTATVTAHYAGWLTDGKSFDASYKRGQPFSTALNRVIKGWTEGMKLMKEGSIYLFHIPWNLAYGETGQGMIPAKADLIFRIELEKVN